MIWDIIANLYYKNYATDLRYLSKVKKLHTLRMLRELVLQCYSSLFLTVMLVTKYLEKSS